MNRIRLYFLSIVSCAVFGLAVTDLDFDQDGYDPTPPEVRRQRREDEERRKRNLHDHFWNGAWQVEANVDHKAAWARSLRLLEEMNHLGKK